MYLRIAFIGLFMASSLAAVAQDFFQEDPVKLREVRVVSSRLEDYAVGATVSSPDSALVKMHRQESLASLLSNTFGVSLKTYGAGGLASVSIRGGGTDHTAVMWNGLNIQSPMSGGVNLSVMPVGFFNNVEVQHGGSGTLFGSGAVSGVIHLSGNEILGLENYMDASGSVGSYGFKSLNADIKSGSNKFASRLSVFGQKADNDFTYTNTSRIGQPEERQTNAGVKQYGVLQENQWRISERSLLTTGFWYQDYDKDLQTLMTSRQPGDTNQKDKNILASVNFKHYYKNGTLKLKQGFIRNKILYSNPDLADPQSDNNSYSWITEGEYKLRLGTHHSINAGVNYTYELAESDGYQGDVVRNRMAAFASGRYGLSKGRGAIVLSFREEMTDNDFQPVVFSFGVEHPLVKTLKLKGNVSKNYRIPNLNDLYWKEDGYSKGNPELKAESGWSGDLGVDFSFIAAGIKTRLSSAFFASRTEDIIVWLPENGGKWMPHNKRVGETLGAEAGFHMSAGFGGNHLALRGFYTYVESTLSSNDEYNGRQMIYVPRHKINGLFSYTRKRFYATLAGSYNGERFYDYDSQLDAYALFDASVGYKLDISGICADISVKVNNLINAEYQVVAWYAMPPRNYRINLNITI
ncbi:TonB-dependent receptor plug domain-containing protein [Marinilabilia rubra]|uniref:TonB-dependent receptor n=1 Tax=Marinilabilia rubra TaxID=2162893 RepID=A0A2U2B3M1_9BACT|nr:TonB-dependent receptor [Marinilabilia rubra]PWD97659.1 TonB-dependent receptor [Marinilabilia rubra]